MDEAEICSKVAIMDHGKIVAYDTPCNLKKQYTSNITRIKVIDNDPLIEYLELNSIKYVIKDNIFTIHSTKLGNILDIVSRFKNSISDFETSKGTLNDVFLSITGKEIR
jgi:ABC-2 type transport system ATP-binding protein